MTDQFQHVMVLVSIIIGLGITYILIGVGSIIERLSGHGTRLRLSWAHGGWVAFLFVWMVSFWWWEFRLLVLLKTWTLGHYFFIVIYAVLLFLLAVILIPSDWGTTESLDEYFLSKRHWFYPVYLMAALADVIDSLLKGGWPYLRTVGLLNLAFTAVAIPVCIVGFRSRSIRVHSIMAAVLFIWLVVLCFEVSPKLTF